MSRNSSAALWKSFRFLVVLPPCFLIGADRNAAAFKGCWGTVSCRCLPALVLFADARILLPSSWQQPPSLFQCEKQVSNWAKSGLVMTYWPRAVAPAGSERVHSCSASSVGNVVEKATASGCKFVLHLAWALEPPVTPERMPIKRGLPAFEEPHFIFGPAAGPGVAAMQQPPLVVYSAKQAFQICESVAPSGCNRVHSRC
mmetsp:Transcript_19370/g.48489  ORF Transcript_19370/g.48489 Transcript_19370/m.48489 type:complete len:200 (-) Transcript_19370:1145-1744(-)